MTITITSQPRYGYTVASLLYYKIMPFFIVFLLAKLFNAGLKNPNKSLFDQHIER